MGKVTQAARERGRRLARAAAPTVLESIEQVPALRDRLDEVTTLRDRLGQLERRVAEQQDHLGRYQARLEAVEAEAQEARHLQLRVAELADIVSELLLPAADRDETRLAELRQRYSASL